VSHWVPLILFPSLWYVQRKQCTDLASRVAISPNGLNWASTWASSPRSPIECVQNDYYAMVCPVQTVHLFCTNTNTVSKWIKMRFHMTHITYEFQRVHPKLIMSLLYVQCKLCTYLVLRLALSPNGPNRAPPDPRYQGVPSDASKTIYEPMFDANRAHILHRCWHYLKRDRNESPHDPHHLGVPSDAFNTIFEPTVRSTQTIHQSCIKVALSPNGLNWASTRASSPTSPTECVQNDFYAYGMFGAHNAPILHWH
jgi:hypothetical protein